MSPSELLPSEREFGFASSRRAFGGASNPTAFTSARPPQRQSGRSAAPRPCTTLPPRQGRRTRTRPRRSRRAPRAISARRPSPLQRRVVGRGVSAHVGRAVHAPSPPSPVDQSGRRPKAEQPQTPPALVQRRERALLSFALHVVDRLRLQPHVQLNVLVHESPQAHGVVRLSAREGVRVPSTVPTATTTSTPAAPPSRSAGEAPTEFSRTARHPAVVFLRDQNRRPSR